MKVKLISKLISILIMIGEMCYIHSQIIKPQAAAQPAAPEAEAYSAGGQAALKNLSRLFTYPSLWGDISFVDLDGDGLKEVIGGGLDEHRNMCASLVVYEINQQKLWERENFYPEKYLVVDLDGDGKKEIIGNGKGISERVEYPERNLITSKTKYTILILDYKGNLKAQWDFDADVYPKFSLNLIDDLDNDGKKELVCKADAVSADNKYAFFILDDKGNVKGNILLPPPSPAFIEREILIRDIDADGKKEIAIFFGERLRRGSAGAQERDIFINEGNRAIVFSYGLPFYTYRYFNGDLNLITLTSAQEEAFINALALSIKQGSQLNFPFNNKQHTLKVEQREVKPYGGKEYPAQYVFTMSIYDSESNLIATYQPELVYTGGPLPVGALPYGVSTRVRVIDLNNDGNDEIIWLDDYWSEDPTFKVFSLKEQ
ncbi:MAG: hypothetical protein ABH952_11050 [Candidatus Omnitrophota bacterium]